MDTRRISGKEVSFHEAAHASRFLGDSRNIKVARDYLDAAERKGETKFITPDGNKYIIKHDKDKKTFSVKWVSSS